MHHPENRQEPTLLGLDELPNGTHVSPSNFAMKALLMGAKSVGVVFTFTPGSNSGSCKSRRLVAWAMMFSRERSLPHCRSTAIVRRHAKPLRWRHEEPSHPA